DLSEMYIARYSYLDKVRLHLASKGTNFFTPGGQYHDVMRVSRKYGLVPESVYTGRVGDETGHDHEKLDTLMERYVKKMLKAGKTSPTDRDWKYINKLLDKYLGEVPSSFTYEGKTYTPLSFMNDYLQINPDDYIEITSYTHHPYYQAFILEDQYNWTQDHYYNLPLEEFIQVVEEALAKGYTVGWDGDVSEETFLHERGIAYLPTSQQAVTTALRQKTYEDKSSKIDHLMHIVGIANDKFGKQWYWVKNSWGQSLNPEGGYLYMSAPYLKLKTVALIVNKKALSKDIRAKLKVD
ncbi:MAG: C1 family peptidase, partial [Bacteroidota bacterium]